MKEYVRGEIARARALKKRYQGLAREQREKARSIKRAPVGQRNMVEAFRADYRAHQYQMDISRCNARIADLKALLLESTVAPTQAPA